MPDGGEVAVAVVVALPGHTMPLNADPATEAGFTAWVNSIHPKFVEHGLADKLIEEGYDTVASTLHLDEDELRVDFDAKTAHARQFVAAAQAVCRALGYINPAPAPGAGSREKRETQQTELAKVPVESASQPGCGVGGLGTVQAFQAWFPRLITWARSNFGEVAAASCDAVRRDTGVALGALQGAVSKDFEFALAEGLITGLPDVTVRFLGSAATSSSGLELLQLLVHPVLGAKGEDAKQQALTQYEDWPSVANRGALLGWLQGFEAHCELLDRFGETVTDARRQQKLTACCSGLDRWADDLRAATMGAQGSKVDFDFMSFVNTMAMEGAQARAKQGKQAKKKQASVAEEAEEAPVKSVQPRKGARQGAKQGAKARTGPRGLQGLCTNYSRKGFCSREQNTGFCPFQHYLKDEIEVLDEELGQWRPKKAAKSRAGEPQASLAGQEEVEQIAKLLGAPEGDREDNPGSRPGVDPKARSSALAAVYSLLAGLLILHPAHPDPSANPNPSQSSASAGDLTNNTYPCQSTSESEEAASCEASSRGLEAQDRVAPGPPHPKPSHTLVKPHTSAVFSGCRESEGRIEGPSIILDIGATDDLIGCEAAPSATRVHTLTHPIKLFTAGGVKAVRRVGDLTLGGALRFTQAMVAPWSHLTLVSLPTRLSQGWSWRAAGKQACLVSPDGENHRFVLDKGLFRYNPDHSDSPVAMPAEGEGQGAPSKAAPETAKQVRSRVRSRVRGE